MEECDHCHAQPWKYQFTENRSPDIETRLCERCYVETLQSVRGVYDVKVRQSRGDKLPVTAIGMERDMNRWTVAVYMLIAIGAILVEGWYADHSFEAAQLAMAVSGVVLIYGGYEERKRFKSRVLMVCGLLVAACGIYGFILLPRIAHGATCMPNGAAWQSTTVRTGVWAAGKGR